MSNPTTYCHAVSIGLMLLDWCVDCHVVMPSYCHAVSVGLMPCLACRLLCYDAFVGNGCCKSCLPIPVLLSEWEHGLQG